MPRFREYEGLHMHRERVVMIWGERRVEFRRARIILIVAAKLQMIAFCRTNV